MSDLLIPDLDEALVQALEARATQNGRSVEAEHRAILVAALSTPKKQSFVELLSRMPDVGLDADFERQQRLQ